MSHADASGKREDKNVEDFHNERAEFKDGTSGKATEFEKQEMYLFSNTLAPDSHIFFFLVYKLTPTLYSLSPETS